MADNTTTTPTPSNGVPLSGLPALTAPVNGEELLLITKNNQSLKTTAAALKAYINAEMATLAGMQQAVKTVSDRIDTLVNGNASSAIDTFNEIEAFLTGITDTETLTGLLADLKSAITTETDNKLSGKVDKVTGKGLSTNDYTDDDKAKLTALPASTQLTEKIDEAKLALFIDQWNAACGTYGKYDPANAPDAKHPFYINTLWLTYNEAVVIMLQLKTWGTSREDFVWGYCATNIPKSASAREYTNSFCGLKVVNFSMIHPISFVVCLNSDSLTKILNLDASYLKSVSNSFDTPNLEVLEISNLKISLDLSKCPLINLASWQGLVPNAANTSEITVTVHPNVYAKLSGDTTNAAAAALTADELAAWQAVMTAASAKNIAFATTA